ncbi:hypothetical protein PMIN01_08609 [Paraphaeosphaeria minitans]|uniref:Uncharacterized protein n=1 Tax=Paraphaeosphaeria minitans TaxID=565426 RepID=A0A9P6GCB1_9PLEO|nr:hypothetical protein PMIN01_08609 [Paraphaeosphaeria minitans]
MRLLHLLKSGEYVLEEHTDSTLSENVPQYAFISHTWGVDKGTYQDWTSEEGFSARKRDLGYRSVSTQTLPLQRPCHNQLRKKISTNAWDFLKCAGAVTVGVLCTALMSDYSTLRHRGGGGSDGFFLGSSVMANWITLLNKGRDAASNRENPTKSWYAERPSFLFRDPSPSLPVAAVVAYQLAFRHLHVILSSRSRFHIHILAMGGMTALLLASIGGVDMLDTALVVMPMAVNISLLVSYVVGMLWTAVARPPSENGDLYEKNVSKDNKASPLDC